MTKKEKQEFQEQLNNPPKDKYIYNRYNGIISKYKQIDENTYIETKTGITINLDQHILLGKTSEKLIYLIEKNDIVNGHRIIYDLKQSQNQYKTQGKFVTAKGYTFAENEIKTILTHEEYEKYCFRKE